jgi:outer membrane protein
MKTRILIKAAGCSLLLYFFTSTLVNGQKLAVDDAMSIALKNNYGILFSRASADIDKANNTAGNAGMLPGIEISGSDNYSINNVSQDLSTGVNISSNNAISNSFNAGIVLNWTLFDGGKMFVTKKKLDEIESLGEIQFKDKVMQTLFNVVIAYYNVVKQKQQLASYNEVINYNEERVKILQASFNAGLSPKTDLLQARVDLNVNLELAIQQETLIVSVKRILNQLMGREADTPFELEDSIPVNYKPDKKELSSQLFIRNPQVLSSTKAVEIASLSVKEVNSLRFPEINLSAGYNFLNSNNSAGNITANRTYGPVIGGSITIPIYLSGNINRQARIAKLQLQSSGYTLESDKLEVNTQMLNALTEFENQQKMLSIEKETAIIAKENLDISMHRLRLGQTTSLEVRQAQESYEASHTRLINFEYVTKVAETKLKQLTGSL